MRDKPTPIQVKFNFALSNDDIDDVLGGRRKRQAMNLTLDPVLDQYIPTIVQAEVCIAYKIGNMA